MRLEIRAISRMKTGPERDLVDDYLARATALGRSLGLGPAQEREIDPRNLNGKDAETEALTSDLEPGALVLALDETGKDLRSQQFADLIAASRDDGVRQAVF